MGGHMTESKEIKPKSFRIDDATADKIKEISQEIGGNQQQTLSKLLECYEMQKGKVILTERKAEIETFENYVTLLTRMYMGALEDNQNVTQTVRAEFESLLKAKDSTIMDLQDKIKGYKSAADQSNEDLGVVIQQMQTYKQNQETLEKKLEEERENFKSVLEDKDTLNKALTDTANRLNNDLKIANVAKDTYDRLKGEMDVLQKRYGDLEAKYNKLEIEISMKQADHKADIAEQERKHNAEIAEYQAKYLALLEQMKQQRTVVKQSKGRDNGKKEKVKVENQPK